MRHEMDPAFQWDFTHIFESKEAWEAAYAEAQTAVQVLSTVPGTLGTSAASLKAGLDAVYGAAEKAQLVSLYAFLHKSGDNGNADYQTMEGRAMQLGIALSSALAFMEPEILAIDRDTLVEERDHKGTHPDAVVRVCGYSAFFGLLTKDMQNEIIGRLDA